MTPPSSGTATPLALWEVLASSYSAPIGVPFSTIQNIGCAIGYVYESFSWTAVTCRHPARGLPDRADVAVRRPGGATTQPDYHINRVDVAHHRSGDRVDVAVRLAFPRFQ